VIRAVGRRFVRRGHEMVASREGLRGLVEGSSPARAKGISGLLHAAGRFSEHENEPDTQVDGGVRPVARKLREERLDSSSCNRRRDTLARTLRSLRDHGLFRCRRVPKTLDNDLSAPDYTFGSTRRDDRRGEGDRPLHTTAESHNVVM